MQTMFTQLFLYFEEWLIIETCQSFETTGIPQIFQGLAPDHHNKASNFFCFPVHIKVMFYTIL